MHDGPPYANGDVHVGHALNKILKDITNRYKLLTNHKVDFKPGWDCHGLPIEIKAIKTNDYKEMTPSKIRKTASQFSKTAIASQMNAFRRWGIMADWSNPSNCYFTFNKQYEASELSAFYKLYQKRLVYRDLKPVFWSPSSKTALAEAELEYKDNHVSRSVYVGFKVCNPHEILPDFIDTTNVYALSWTTQPWTIPSNQALCFSSNSQYCLVKSSSSSQNDTAPMYLIAHQCLENVTKHTGCSFDIIKTFEGKLLNGVTCVHPMDIERTTKMIPASHVTTDTGTGIVHTSPAHGVDDFMVAQNHSLYSKSDVDDNGCFTADAGYDLHGKFVFTGGNDAVIDKLKENLTLFHEHKYTHSYPYDWRTKKPIFVKTSRQWFIDTSSLWKKSQQALNEVKFHPSIGKATMKQQLKQRPYWCISRQRVWGLPIPVFYQKESGEVLLTDQTFGHLISMVKKHGSDVWWDMSMEQLLPQSVIEKSGAKGITEDYKRGNDILDIWFDSGVSWAAVLGEHKLDGEKQVADFYLEGKDQFGGWFYSSLLTSVGLQGCAPYKNIMVHGFTVSASGQKMSKSLGNVVDPMMIIDGGKDKNKDPSFGADTLRWWVASANVHQEVQISKSIITKSSDSVLKIRNCIRYLLSNLNHFDPHAVDFAKPPLCAVDQHQRHRLHNYTSEITRAYESYSYSRVALLTLTYITQLSSYFSCVKDRLYCEEQRGDLRKSCQSVLFLILEVLLKSVAPILPHLAEEAMVHHPCRDDETPLFLSGWFRDDVSKASYDAGVISAVDTAHKFRDILNTFLQGKQPTLYDVTIVAPKDDVMNQLRLLQDTETSSSSDLCEIIMTSHCTLASSVTSLSTEEVCRLPVKIDDSDCYIVAQQSSRHKCPRCRRKTAPRSGQLCDRCTNVLTCNWET
uniref:isoleucine--tRNA ligase n=1 Tax=Phallusia mammillata TaxID=59560 RepID=A0A6F9DEE0_9ASCI|nr:isoleucine--tRNA ligase, mitochondrial [Phallusia mammillata]